MSKIKELNVHGRNVRFLNHNGLDYVCITDIAALKNPLEPKDVVKNWLRSRSTLSFVGLWEKLHNPDFKGVEFDPLLAEAGENSFTMSPSRFIEEKLAQPQRLERLNQVAIKQMQILIEEQNSKLLGGNNE
ncbi:MAG: KilA-N domain-containing protein [Lentisphaeria bacterium]|nr:KilA-N domain-containing protein [Lentisphaeria bacterium]